MFKIGDTVRVRWAYCASWNDECNAYWRARVGQLVVIDLTYGDCEFYRAAGHHGFILDRSWATSVNGLRELIRRYYAP